MYPTDTVSLEYLPTVADEMQLLVLRVTQVKRQLIAKKCSRTAVLPSNGRGSVETALEKELDYAVNAMARLSAHRASS